MIRSAIEQSGGRFSRSAWGYGFFWEPSKAQPLFYRLFAYSRFVGPFRQAHGSAECRNHSVSTDVPSLLFSTSPYTVLWEIALAVVNSVYGQTFRSVAHIGIKVLKTIFSLPSVANSDAPAAVSIEVQSVGVVASTLHRLPRLVSARSCPSWTHSVFGHGGNVFFSVQAAAGFGFARSEGVRSGYGNTAAIANAIPVSTLTLGRGFGNNCKSVEFLTNKVIGSARKICNSHAVVPLKQWFGQKPRCVSSTSGLRHFNSVALGAI